MKEKAGMPPAMSENELNGLKEAVRTPFVNYSSTQDDRDEDVVDLTKTKGKEKIVAEDVAFDVDMGIDMDTFTGPEVAGGSNVEFNLVDEPDEESEEVVEEDADDEPEFYNTEDKEVTYLCFKEPEGKDYVDLDKSDWFKETDDKVPEVPLYQHIKEPNTKEMERRIISWKYNAFVNAYMIKRRGGEICYIKHRKHFATLPRWDLRRLAQLPLLSKNESARAKVFESVIRNAAENDFVEFGYQKPTRRRSKRDKQWVSWKGKIVLKVAAPKIMNRVRVPDTQPPRLQNFEKWFYDNQTGEAVIRLKGDERLEIRLFDPMEVFSFCNEDLKVLCENEIKHGAGDDTEKEANLFVKIANKARGVRAEIESLAEKVRIGDEHRMEMDDLTRQLDQSITKRFEKSVVGEASGSGAADETEVIVLESPEKEITEAEDDIEAGTDDVTNPLAEIESRQRS